MVEGFFHAWNFYYHQPKAKPMTIAKVNINSSKETTYHTIDELLNLMDHLYIENTLIYFSDYRGSDYKLCLVLEDGLFFPLNWGKVPSLMTKSKLENWLRNPMQDNRRWFYAEPGETVNLSFTQENQ